MDLTVHQKLESIREDLNSQECKHIMKNIKTQKGDLYDALGLGFAVESIYRDKPFSRKDEDARRLEDMRRFYGRKSKKSSGSMKHSDRQGHKEYEKNITHEEVRQQYFDNIPNM